MLVIEHKLVTYDYFMDSLQVYEVGLLVDMIPWSAKQSYEQTRLLLWGVLSPYLKQKKSPKQILPLVTDIVHTEKALPDEELNELRTKIQNIYSLKNG